MEEQDEVKTWFDKQVSRAKKFQPLTMLNQKLRGLEVFESNESHPLPNHATLAHSTVPQERQIDPDELIARQHWQRSTNHDLCTDPTCGKNLGPINGNINCRKCGRLFCEVHTMYQMKLSRSANHEPVRGFWARVCETCYKSREGYNDYAGASVDLLGSFQQARKKRVERHKLEESRLEKRLTKLTRLLAESNEQPRSGAAAIFSPMASLSGQSNTVKNIEQSIVAWEDDESVSKCPFCQQEFGSWTFRRHHCRICGRVVCADTQTACSTSMSLNVATCKCAPPQPLPTLLTLIAVDTLTQKPLPGSQQVVVDVRLCRDCNHTIFARRDFIASLQFKPTDQRSYETMRQFERGIRQLLPSFQRALLTLQPDGLSNDPRQERPPPTHAQIQEAGKIRKRLIDSFGKYSVAAKRIRDLPTDSPVQKKLQMSIYAYASSFLHTNMLPLKSLPQLLRNGNSSSSTSHRRHQHKHSNHSITSNLRHSELVESDTASQAASETSTVISQLEVEEKDLRERLVVLEEQQFMVNEMLRSAKNARRFEEVAALSRNGDELENEIQELKASIAKMEKRWAAAYKTGTA